MVTRGPPVCDWPLATMLVPPKPVSDEPIESVMTRLGSSSRNFSLMLGREQRGSAGEQEQRRQVVFVVRVLVCEQRVQQRPGHRVTGEEEQVHLVVVDRPPHLVGVEFRCQDSGLTGEQRHPGGRLGGAMDHRRDRVADHRRVGGGLLGQVVLVLDGFARREVGAAEQHSIDVLVTPHHAFGEPGGAAGVEQVDVVGAALAEITLG